MRMYRLEPASASYEEGREYTESEIIWWAENIKNQFSSECEDITLIVDRDRYENIDIHRAIEVLEKDNEFVEPIVP